MFKLSTRFSHHHHHTLRRTVPPATRIFSTTHGAAQPKTPKSKSETDSERKIPSKDDVNPKSMESTRSGTHDEVAHTNKAAYGPNTNPTEEKAIADAEEKTERPGSPLEYSAANPDVSHQGEDKSSCVGGRERSKASGGSKRA